MAKGVVAVAIRAQREVPFSLHFRNTSCCLIPLTWAQNRRTISYRPRPLFPRRVLAHWIVRPGADGITCILNKSARYSWNITGGPWGQCFGTLAWLQDCFSKFVFGALGLWGQKPVESLALNSRVQQARFETLVYLGQGTGSLRNNVFWINFVRVS